eukprot:TRINITY_DN55693_c0_g1_i1.p1 TRINITY_DN55693_c0_g1~~TRINITY_DN55693_c0_g1_i1.p1  ORF type:complete len:461 (+),score=85.76 TRINITY_DN55693_c0_g1_i1:89-1384(+)
MAAECAEPPERHVLQPCYGFHAIGGLRGGRDGSKLGQVYTAFVRYLLEHRGADWAHRGGPMGASRCNLLLGEAQGGGVEWAKLGGFGVKPLVNFCRGFQALTRKTMMAQNLRAYAATVEQEASFLPLTFIFTKQRREQDEFVAEFARRSKEGLDNTWILKPSGGAHGDDIEVMNNLTSILEFLESAGNTAWIVQKYLENPLLLPARRKFDVRCMVLVTHDYRIYLFSEGILRTCSVAFSLEDLGDRYAHLANHCLQANHSAYGTFEGEPENLLSYDAFDAFLRACSEDHFEGGVVSLETHILPQIEKQVLFSLMAVRDQLQVSELASYSCFNLFGYDFMLDDSFGVHLVEVNSSPTTDPSLIPCLVEEVVRVAVDPLFPPQCCTSEGDGQARLRSVPEAEEVASAEKVLHGAANRGPSFLKLIYDPRLEGS